MDYFENLVALLLEKEGKWIKQRVKIDLTKEEKANTGKPSIPRPEIDIIAYNPKNNILEIWEVKSFLHSQGVKYDDISKENELTEGKYKLFTSEKYRNIIIKRLINDWTKDGIILKDPVIKIGLAAGKIYKKDEESVKSYFIKKGWELRTNSDLVKQINDLQNEAYENDPYIIVSKLINRK